MLHVALHDIQQSTEYCSQMNDWCTWIQGWKKLLLAFLCPNYQRRIIAVAVCHAYVSRLLNAQTAGAGSRKYLALH